MGVIISLLNHKGGVGKTTSAINIGAGLVELGKKVLLVDLDPQANLSLSLGAPRVTETIYEALRGECELNPVTVKPNLDVVISTLDLSGAEMELINEAGREFILRELFSVLIDDYDYIIIDHLRTYSLYKSVKPLIDRTKSKLIYIAHNAEFKNHEQKLLNFTNRRKRLVYRLINRNIQKLELELVEESDFVWGLSQKDVDNLKEVSNVKNSLIVPPYFPWECQKDRATLGELSKKILILGSMQWYPNVEGALHFIDDIFPHVLQLDSNYKLYIVGQKPDQRLLDKQSDKIIVTGRVPSVDPYIKEADLLVIPNRFGSGIKIKLLESVIKGLPVIMYKENVDGYEHSEFKFPFVVKNSEEFIKAIFTINKNKSLKETFLNKHSQQFEEFKKFDFQL